MPSNRKTISESLVQLQNSWLTKHAHWNTSTKKTCRLGWAPSALPAMHGALLWERWEGSLFVVPFLHRNIQVVLIWMSFSLRRAVYLGDQSHLDYFLKEGRWEQWRCQNGCAEWETCRFYPNCDQYLAEDNQHHKIDPHDCVCVDHHCQSAVYDVISWGVQIPCWMIM